MRPLGAAPSLHPSLQPSGASAKTAAGVEAAGSAAPVEKPWQRFLAYVRRTVTTPADSELDVLRKRDFYILCVSSLTVLLISVIPLVLLRLWDFLIYRMFMGGFPAFSIVWLTKRKTIIVPLTAWTIMWSTSVFYATLRYSFQQGAIMVALTMMMGPTVGLFGGGVRVGIVHFFITCSCVFAAAILNQHGIIGNQIDHGSPELRFSYFMAATSSVMVIFVGSAFYVQLRREKSLLVQSLLEQQADFAAHLLQEVRSSAYKLHDALQKVPAVYSKDALVAVRQLEELRESLRVMADAAQNDHIFQRIETKVPISVVAVEQDPVLMQSIAQTVWSLGMALVRGKQLSDIGEAELTDAEIIIVDKGRLAHEEHKQRGMQALRPAGASPNAWVIVIGGASESAQVADGRVVLLRSGVLPRDMRTLLCDVAREIADERKKQEEISESDKILSTHKLGLTWEIGEIVGRGGNGTVYKAHDVLTGGTAAVKVVSVGDGKLDVVVREIRVMCSVEHPDIVHYFFCQRDDPIFYLFMELCDYSLQNVLDYNGPLTEADAKWAVQKLVSALAYIHKKGIVHGDIKPGNVLVKDGQPKLSDFGTSGWQTRETKLQGTLAYMSPECLRGEGSNAPNDIWAVGCFAAMCMGCPPKHMLNRAYLGLTPENFVLEFPEQAPRALPDRALAFVQSCLQPNPANRPTAQELLAHSWLEDTAVASFSASGGGSSGGAASGGGVGSQRRIPVPRRGHAERQPSASITRAVVPSRVPFSSVIHDEDHSAHSIHSLAASSASAASQPRPSQQHPLGEFDSASTLNSGKSLDSAAFLQSRTSSNTRGEE